MPNKILVRNEYLNEFCYDLLFNITDEQKKGLSNEFLKMLKSSVKCKNFAEFSTIDEKIRFFSQMGIDNAIVFFQDKLNSVNALKKILEKYEEKRTVSATKDVSGLKIFVSSDKQVKYLLGLMADSIHNRSYFLNLDFNKTGYHIDEWTKRIDTPDSRHVMETMYSADVVAKTMFNTCLSLDCVEGLLSMKPLDIKVLLYLYQYRHTYMHKDRIYDQFAGYVPRGKITTTFKRLLLNEYIRKGIDNSNTEYSITGGGIEAVNKFMQRILKQSNF